MLSPHFPSLTVLCSLHQRIMNVAEEASLDKYKQDETADYYNAKRLNPKEPMTEEEMLEMNYRNLTLISNSHFDGIPINESVSSVHVPTNVYVKGECDLCSCPVVWPSLYFMLSPSLLGCFLVVLLKKYPLPAFTFESRTVM